jgi:RNA polymerase sigma factor (sigma-70 family)
VNEHTDSQLLRAYADQRSEPAFQELVRRHLDLVHSAALRMVRDSHLAQDVSQSVFVALANNAAQLTERRALAGWLHRTAQNIAAQFVRTDVRRRAREQEAAAMNQIVATSPETGWEQIEPHLDDALGELNEPDRDAILLRYFGGKSAGEMAATLGISDEAAQKRVGRAVERLRQFFSKRGISIGAGGLVVIISAHAVQAAPAGLATIISAGALTGAAASSAIVATAAKTAALTTFQKVLITASIAVAVGAGIYGVQRQRQIMASGSQNIQPTGRSSTNSTASTAQALEANPAVVRESLSDASVFTLDSAPGSLALRPDGKILVGSVLFGAFVDPKTGRLGFYHRAAMRLNPDGSLDRSFLTDSSRNNSSSFMAHLAIATNGQILVTGSFDSIEGEPREGIAVLHPDGSLDKSMVPWRGLTNPPGRYAVPAGVYPATFVADGTIAVATVSVEAPRGPQTVYRLDKSGAWITPSNNLVGEEFLRPSGMIQTLSEVGFWGRQPVEWTRATPHPLGPADNTPFGLHASLPTAYDAAKVFRALFEEVPIKLCHYAARLPDGGTILAIQDQFIDGSQSAPGRFMRFDANWRPDFSFTNSFEADRRGRITLLRQPDGRLLVAGLQGRMNGQDCAGVTRLEADGRTDPSFHCDMTNGLDGRVMDMVLQPDGRIVICGFFSVVNGAEVPHIARLNPDGSLDATFHPPFMTRAQFDRQRLGKHITLPVASLSPAPVNTAAAGQAVSSKTIVITQLTVFGDTAQVQYIGEPRQTYILQSKDRLQDSEWTNISTNQASSAGSGTLFDPQAGKFPQRFYRIAQQ